ncbi:hypothetical protein B0T21DRAFT_420999 [Apiosordaria backusii]|uniref:Zn(2)-C6 fungal-type domain-containing protein n=1 Tax=Apiosordaria backusii TaxID=314023 RepID=A0AA40F087_9PEZI|nr:hypothetical protein B0T21DRAFT_420999 [Apiosordaria backusii]
MVGVPGKYKGCNTCRLRRVKCDNERPLCRKCLDSGRECAGYERETVFIIGTIEDQGRCSSHPPRVVKSKKGSSKKSSSKRSEDDDGRFQLVANTPLRPAWDDLISLSCRGQTFQVQIAALFTPLSTVTRAYATDEDEGEQNRTIFLSFPTYQPPDLTPYPGEDDFQLFSQCMVHLAPPSEARGGQGTQTDSIFMFLYEHNNSTTYNPHQQPPWKPLPPPLQTSTVRRLGPPGFRHFPNHHFFARVYRPAAIWTAILSPTPTPCFLSLPEWQTTPFESHPKSSLDTLLDILSLLPALFSRFTHITSPDQPPTLSRRLLAQDLLSNLIGIELQLSQWYTSVTPSRSRPTYWIADPSTLPYPGTVEIPFTETFAFSNGTIGLGLVYYWAGLVLLWPKMWRLYWLLFEPVVDGMVEPVLGGKLAQVDPMRWNTKEVRQAADNVCRAGDWLLAGAAQPDLLGWVVEVVGGFYQELVSSSVGTTTNSGWEDMGGGGGDGRLEMGWVQGFRGRLAQRGRDVAEVVGGRGWVDYVSF